MIIFVVYLNPNKQYGTFLEALLFLKEPIDLKQLKYFNQPSQSQFFRKKA